MTTRNEESIIRKKIEDRLQINTPIEGYLKQVIETAPNNFVQLIFNQPIENEVFWDVILDSLDTLERYVKPEILFLYLSDQLLVPKRKLLRLAIERHEEELWLLSLSKKIEGESFGKMHVLSKKNAKNLPHWVSRYALKGARQGLVDMAAETGNPIPAATLYRVKADDFGLKAAIAALNRNGKSPVVEYIAAAIGPNVDSIIQALQEAFDGKAPPAALRRLK